MGTVTLRRWSGWASGLLALAVFSSCSGNDCCGPSGLLSIQLALTNSGDGQTDTIGGVLANPLRVLVLRDQRPIKGVVVSWTALSGSVWPASSATDASGLAQATWTLGDTVGAWSVTASIPSDTAVNDTVPLYVSFTATARPGAPVALAFRPGPSNTFVGRPLIPVVQVAAIDRGGNVATAFHGSVTVALAADPSGASLTGTTTVGAVDGVAMFTDLSLDRVGAGYMLSASASGLSSATSAAFEIVAPGPGRIAFQSVSSGGVGEIHFINADGSGEVNLTNGTGDYDFAWSPDGSRIAFHSARTGNPEIWVINADGTGLANLTNSPTNQEDFPAWSPDGSRIAFSRDELDGKLEVYVMNADGSGAVGLTTGGGVSPAWSPGGSRIVFGQGSAISLVNADGSGQASLTSGLTGVFVHPVWSPDGAHIAFTRGRIRTLADICEVNADGTGLRNLVTGGGEPAWSPDGSKIAFVAGGEIALMNADGSGVVRLTTGGGSDPAWSPDGSKIAFVGGGGISLINADGSGVVRLTSGHWDRYPAWQPR